MGEGDGGVDEDDGVVGVDHRHTMIAPAAFQRHRERGGESPPPSYSSLASSLDGRRFPPLVHGCHGGGGAGAPPRLDLPLCSLLFRVPRSGRKPFLKYPEIPNFNWDVILTRFSSGYYLSCAQRRAPTDLRGGHKTPGHAWHPLACPGVSWGLWAPVCIDSKSQKSHIFQNNSP